MTQPRRPFTTIAMLLTSLLLLQGCATAERHVVPDVRTFDSRDGLPDPQDGSNATVRVMTLNLAHGRGESFHQLLQKTDATIGNLEKVSTLLQRERPDVVALQEADGPSYWSGNFHHVDYLAQRADFSHAVNGLHVDGLGLAYGTALLSDLDLEQAEVVTFNPDLAMTPKGFVVSTIEWPGQALVKVDVVSLHLEFSSAETRRLQARELIDFMRARQRPMIVMGDFNTEWAEENTAVQLIADELGLTAYRPQEQGQGTFASNDKRLDWILISPGLEFRQYQVMSDAVSDHRGVIAELGLNNRLVRNDYAE
jgi:endonuclease/exonuclease/phosphatase family metal-dependent hydrolase